MLRRRRQERELARMFPGWAVNRRIWSEAAAEVGAEVDETDPNRIEVSRGGASVEIRLHVTPIDDPETLERALDKEAGHRLLREAGVSVPEQTGFTLADLGPALAAIEAGGSWVVKPGGGHSGRGTTTGIRTGEDLERAAVRAARSGELILERQAPGEEYRVLLLDGEPIGAVRRDPPSVVGDGKTSIARLIEAENRRRLEARGEAGIEIVTLDLDALLALGAAGLGPRSVPGDGEEVAVKGSRSQGGARETETVPLEALAPELVAELRAGAEAFGLRLAGFDLTTPDLGRSLTDAGGGVLEANGTPGLHYHYLVRDPAAATPVAVPVLEALFSD